MENISKMLANHRANIDHLVARLQQNDGLTPQIEIDLLLEELRCFYSDLLMHPVCNEVHANPETKVEVAVQSKLQEPDLAPLMAQADAEPIFAEESKNEIEEAVAQHPTLEEIEGQPNDTLFEDIQPEPKLEPEPAPTEAPEPARQEIVSNSKQQPSLFDYLKSGNAQQPAQRTIAESLGEVQKSRVEERINPNKVQDLRTIININDKFSFMNELFHNNMKGYNDFILRLNAIYDREEALAYVHQIAEQYSWDDESMAVKTFYGIFDRKF